MRKEDRIQIIAENITYYRKLNNMTQKELAEKVGIKPSTLSDYIKLRSAPSFGIIQKMADVFGIQKSDIDTTFKDVELNEPSSTLQEITETSSKLDSDRQLVVLDCAKSQLDEQKNKNNNVVKLFDYDYYDQPASAGTGQYLNDIKRETIQLPVDVDADFVIPIYGDSMEPKYHSGDYAFIKLSVNLSDGEIGVFQLNDSAYIKQLIISDNGAYLHSLNSNSYKDIPVDERSDFRVIGKVVGSVKP